ncbi:hypothetical protein [Bifidobacterium pullorum]|uniref:hypothetical protein n=1 Tax=Bifidobacterium pullorum TaxID=78448 RepID=UPI003C6C83A4
MCVCWRSVRVRLRRIELYLIPAFGDRGMRDITARDVQHWWDAFRPVSRDVDLRRVTVCRAWRACGSTICARPR